MPKTTKEHFKVFVNECLYWIDLYGLKEWFVTFCHTDKGKMTKATYAWIQANHDSKNVFIHLCMEWDENDFPLTNFEIRKLAHHEVCELLLDGLESKVREKFLLIEKMAEVMVEESTHEIIARLENVHWLKSIAERKIKNT